MTDTQTAKALHALNCALYLMETGKAEADPLIVAEIKKAFFILESALTTN